MLAEEEEQVIHRVRTLLNLRIATARDLVGSISKFTQPGSRSGAHSLDSAAKTMRWKNLFLSYDKDKSGTITFKELRSMMRNSLHLSETACPDTDLKIIFERLDEDGSGAIEFDEFCNFVQTKNKRSQEMPSSLGRAIRLAMSREKVRTMTDVRDLFAKSDLDCDNEMSVYELRRFFRDVLRLNQHEVSEVHIKKLHKSLDADCTGSIDQNEFFKWISNNVDMPGVKRRSRVSRSLPTSQTGFGAHLGITPPLHSPPGTAPSPGKSDVAERACSSSDKRPASTPARRRGGPPVMTLGGRRTEYLSIPGAERLNRVEQRLFEAGFDVRGEFFKVSENPDGLPLSRGGLLRGTSALLSGLSSSGDLSAMKKHNTTKELLRQALKP